MTYTHPSSRLVTPSRDSLAAGVVFEPPLGLRQRSLRTRPRVAGLVKKKTRSRLHEVRSSPVLLSSVRQVGLGMNP